MKKSKEMFDAEKEAAKDGERLASLFAKEVAENSSVVEVPFAMSLLEELLYGTKSTTYSIDSGYDYSTYGQSTNDSYVASDYQTIGDFLEEPSGNTVATHQSGNGVDAETLKSCFESEINEVIHSWYDSHKVQYSKDEVDDLEYARWEEFIERLWLYEVSGSLLIEKFSEISLQNFVEKHIFAFKMHKKSKNN